MAKEKEEAPKLPAKYQKENVMFAWGALILWLAWLQFTFNTWRVQYEKWARHNRAGGIFIPAWPRKIEILNFMNGQSCNDITNLIRSYGIPLQRTMMQWELIPGGGIGMRFCFYVPRPQWQLADCILAQHQGPYVVNSAPGKLRGYEIGKPWGAPAAARSFDEAIIDLLAPGALARTVAKLPKATKRPKTAPNGRKG